MKIFRFILINIVLLFFVVMAVSLFIPSHVRISRAINMAAKPAVVLDAINDINKWQNWYPGFDTLKPEALQTDNGRWIAAKTSGTTYTLKERTADEVIVVVSSGKRRTITSGWKAITYDHTDSLTVQWYLDFKLRWYPWEKLSSLVYDQRYGPGMEKGLQNLKKLTEH